MNFIDLKAQFARVEDQVRQRINTVLEHGQYINGPEVAELEEALAEYVGVRHCIGVSSGTDALLVAMMALEIGPGDEVITTPFTFIATGEMIALLGAKPVFVDIDPQTYNIDPNAISSAVTPRTRAVMPVSLYGQCADMESINRVASSHGIAVIEDAAQSLGATQQGMQSCSLSEIGCTSFFPSKPLGCYGDGGACFTNDDNLASAMKEIRNHGQDRRYHHPRIGLNARLDTLQAAILLAKLEVFPEEVQQRTKLGYRYTSLIAQRWPDITTPYIAPGNTSVYAQYTVQVDDRERIIRNMTNAEIPHAVHYPVPLTEQPALMDITTEAHVPVSIATAKRVLSLPMHPYLSDEDMSAVIESLL